MKDIQTHILGLMEKEAESRRLTLVTAHSYANTGNAAAMLGTSTVARFSFEFQTDEVNIRFQGAEPGPIWSNPEYREWAGVENRHRFKLHESEWVEAMLARWKELLDA